MQKMICRNLEELSDLTAKILDCYPDHRIFCLEGNLGSGKTTAIKYFCKKLEVNDVVSSPTFSIVNEYKTPDDQRIYHFDFYRLKDIAELMDIGYEEYFFSGSYCFVEWPEKFAELLPDDYVYIKIYDTGESGTRLFEYFSSNEKY